MSPTLPIYNSQKNINANIAEPLRDEAAQPFKDQQQVIGTVADITQKWSHANDVMQYTEAWAKYGVALTDIESRASGDPDFKNSDKYYKEIEDAKKNTLQGISNQQIASKVSLEFDESAAITGIKIGADFQRKQLDYNKVMVKTNLDNIMQKKISANTAAEAEQYEQDFQNILSSNIAAGTIDLATADEIAYNSTKSAYESIVYSDPSRAIEILKKEKDLSSEDKYKLRNEAQQIQKRDKEFQEWQTKQTQIGGTIELSDALYNNTLTPKMVRTMQQQGIIDSETATIFDSLAIDKKYDIPDSTALGQPDYFLRLLEDSNGEKAQVDKVLRDAAKAYGNGKLGVNQYRYFIENAKETFDRQSKGIFTETKEQSSIKAAVKGIEEFDKSNKSNKLKGEMTSKFFDRYKPGEDANKIKNDIINETVVQKKPEISNIPEEGKVMVDKNGNKARVFPDGHYEEVK